MEDRVMVHQVGKDAFYKTWHASGEHIFIYFHSEGGSIVSADRIFPIKKGALVFIHADTYHYTMPDDPEHYDRSKLILSRESLKGILALMGEEEAVRKQMERAIVFTQCNEESARRIERAFAECAIQGHNRLRLLSCCLELMCSWGEASGDSSPAAVGMMGKAVDYIHAHITEDLSVEGICKAVNISKFYFCRQFKAHTGMTVMNYVLNTRLMLAKTELKHPKCSVSEISDRFGFSSVSYFCRVFKEAQGCTPLQYRKRFS